MMPWCVQEEKSESFPEMISQEAADLYRKMSPDERLAFTLQAIEDAMPYLVAGPPEIVARRFELIRRENDLRNRAMLEGFAAAENGRKRMESDIEN